MSLAEIFAFKVSVAELVLRGTLMYWFLFLLFRFVLRRDVGQLGVADVLLLVLVADASQNAMAGGYTSVSEGIVLVGTIAFWSWLLDLLAYYSPLCARLAEPQALQLVRHGRLVRDNLRRALFSLDDLHSQLRQQGIESLSQVKHAYLEADGRVSVIRNDGGD
jgi:uncharacterized membrane protein YcaP (DUF421 family)